MKVREVYNSRLAKILGYNITLYPFIFYYGIPDLSLKVHEWTHIMQIRKKGVIQFYISYLYYYIEGRMQGLGHHDAYMSIPYEQEAYKFQDLFIDWMAGRIKLHVRSPEWLQLKEALHEIKK
jgi:hypothetical protein